MTARRTKSSQFTWGSGWGAGRQRSRAAGGWPAGSAPDCPHGHVPHQYATETQSKNSGECEESSLTRGNVRRQFRGPRGYVHGDDEQARPGTQEVSANPAPGSPRPHCSDPGRRQEDRPQPDDHRPRRVLIRRNQRGGGQVAAHPGTRQEPGGPPGQTAGPVRKAQGVPKPVQRPNSRKLPPGETSSN